jgi:pyruvate/2-oxoglutarate/acetoin dehydrogenase E1 component
MSYLAMTEKVVFLGQAVEFPGTAMTTTLEEIEKEKLIELPVEEDLQMGIATGMALSGMIPVSIFPRWNFLLLAVNQIVNHLDKLPELLKTDSCPKVIIRTGIGSINPLNPGPQHRGDFTEAFKALCQNIEIIRLDSKEMIFPAYKWALERDDGVSTLLIEWSDKYNE